MNDAMFHTDEAGRDEKSSGSADFSYTYSAREHKEIESIRMKYLSPEENKLEQLHRLDRQAERPGTIISILVGVVSTLLLGVGMVLTMVYTRHFALGVAIGLVGIAGASLTYPLYLRITRRERERIAPEILRLSDELLKGSR